jgi:hypothetical protein
LLLTGGMTLVSSGEAAGVLEMIEKLGYDDKKLPRILLIRGFAECSQGHHQAAAGYLAGALMGSSELSSSDRLFLTLLRDICDYHMGRIARPEFIRRQWELAEKDDGEFGLSRRIAYLSEAIAEDGTREGLARHLPPLREAVNRALSSEDASASLGIQARTALLHAEGVLFSQSFHHELAVLNSRMAMGLPADRAEVFGRIGAEQARWTHEANALVRDAVDYGDPRLIGDACYTRSQILFGHQCSASVWLSPELVARHLEQLKAEVIPDVRRAIQCYRASGNIEWELRAKLLLADLAAFAGDDELAKETAGAVLPSAEAYQFDRIAKEARDHLAGDPFFRQLQRKFLYGTKDPDDQDANLTDEGVRERVEYYLETARLPRERLPVLRREIMSLRDIARERMTWCRHLQLIQNKQHSLSASTLYERDPERWCFCDKFGLTSRIGSTDWVVLIKTFKNTDCAGCSAQKPKSDDASSSATRES